MTGFYCHITGGLKQRTDQERRGDEDLTETSLPNFFLLGCVIADLSELKIQGALYYTL